MHPLSTHIQTHILKTKTYKRSICALFKNKIFQAQVHDLETIQVIYSRSLLLKWVALKDIDIQIKFCLSSHSTITHRQ